MFSNSTTFSGALSTKRGLFNFFNTPDKNPFLASISLFIFSISFSTSTSELNGIKYSFEAIMKEKAFLILLFEYSSFERLPSFIINES